MNINKNKLLLFVAFLATIAVVFYRIDYGQRTIGSLEQKQTTSTASQPTLFPFREQTIIYNSNTSATTSSSALQANLSQNKNELSSVLRVIDGDTIVAEVNGQPIHIRLIGINSPEPNDKRTQVACLAQKAKEEAEKLLNGQNIYLEKDATQGDYDKYSRMLAYVLLSGGVNFNKLMIEEGYAYEYTYRLPYKYQDEFKAAQSEAKNAQRGLWNNKLCDN
ncbi:MAG: thermonuclease family protein [bacterium]|nr:thermonuclease family protein [bacterium]